MDNKTVANTIWEQMNVIDKNLVWCMGTNKPKIIEQGLQFQVSGNKFKGIVEIKLNPSDYYTVHFIKIRQVNKKRTKVVENEYTEVYVDHLMPLLADVVEGV